MSCGTLARHALYCLYGRRGERRKHCSIHHVLSCYMTTQPRRHYPSPTTDGGVTSPDLTVKGHWIDEPLLVKSAQYVHVVCSGKARCSARRRQGIGRHKRHKYARWRPFRIPRILIEATSLHWPARGPSLPGSARARRPSMSSPVTSRP
ncbi:hypothetical protein J6590_044897 [Homalodisca vitripennis]|nr:hypothetical protein J6590_044897 [Homalodisca vitripennis]